MYYELDHVVADKVQFAAECLNTAAEADFLCSLYVVHSVFVKGSSLTDFHMPSIAELGELRWSPLVLASLCETRFLIEPSSDSALELLQVYARRDMIFTAFTSHWVFRAGLVLRSQRSAALALTVLERCSIKWPNSEALHKALRDEIDAQTLS